MGFKSSEGTAVYKNVPTGFTTIHLIFCSNFIKRVLEWDGMEWIYLAQDTDKRRCYDYILITNLMH